MAVDFTLPPDVEAVRQRVRDFMDSEVRTAEEKLYANAAPAEPERRDVVAMIVALREKAKEWGVWLPHMPEEWGGLGLGPTAMAFVSAESARTTFGPFVLNAQAPDEGNQHTLLHHATDEQKERYLRPLVEGRVALVLRDDRTRGRRFGPDGDPHHGGARRGRRRVGDQRPQVVHLRCARARSSPSSSPRPTLTPTRRRRRTPRSSSICRPRVGRSCATSRRWQARDNHCEIRIDDLRVPSANVLGGRGNGHLLGQARLGPARLAHCMRWIGQIETALELLVARAEERQLHGAPLADKQAIQWMMADSAMELYAAKLMVLHAAYKIEHGQPFRQEVSFAKHHVANTLWRVVDRADPGARCPRLLGGHAPRAHAPARALRATRGRRRRGAPGAHRPQPAGGLGRDRLARRGDRRPRPSETPLLLRPRESRP